MRGVSGGYFNGSPGFIVNQVGYTWGLCLSDFELSGVFNFYKGLPR